MSVFGKLDLLPRVSLAHTPTPIERLDNLSKALDGGHLYVKRDDCTGLAMGGNKARQLEYYFGEAVQQDADTILITGAVQSNFVRMAAAAAAKLDLACHIQLEERVNDIGANYRDSGNVLLDHILGATIHTYPDGEDEAGADANLQSIANELRSAGKRPYIIPLAMGHPPLGALGYIQAAIELKSQLEKSNFEIDQIFVASGSGSTHAGLLFGCRSLKWPIRITGVCVRRRREQQINRIEKRCHDISRLLDINNPVDSSDVEITDETFSPGYGKLNDQTLSAIKLCARREGLLLDPVYTGKAMAACLNHVRGTQKNQSTLFLHTGGTPGLFAYSQQLDPANESSPVNHGTYD